MSVISDLRLLLWKNYLLQIRQPISTVIEVLIPCVFMLLLVLIRRSVEFIEFKNSTTFNSFEPISSFSFDPNWIILYSPNTTKTTDFINKMLNRNNLTFNVKGFTSEDLMVSYYLGETVFIQNQILCGIVFKSGDNFDKQLKYKLRFPHNHRNDTKFFGNPWFTQYTYPLYSTGARTPDDYLGGPPKYTTEGFLAVQHWIAINAAQLNSNASDKVKVRLQRFPYPPYLFDMFLLALTLLLPLILLISFIYPVVNLTKNLVIEKERRLKESMKMMGLKNWLHWTAWFIKSLIYLAISCILITVCLTISIKNGVGILNRSNSLLIYLFFISYSISCIAFAFLISSLFSKANVCGICSAIIFFVGFIPYFILFSHYHDLDFLPKILSCLSSNTALAFGVMLITMWEGNGVGVQWYNVAETASPDDSLTVGHIIVMFYLDAFIYLCVTLYIEAVFPGDYGIAEKWYFPLSYHYWFGYKQTFEQIIGSNNTVDSGFFETEPKDLKPGIKIVNLCKTFDGKNFAVNNFNLSAYFGQITGLLGHNGAGKTTTMSILTGLFPPSSGTAIVNGFDIRKDMTSVRSSLGICPQFDVLFDELTVEEHLKFFWHLKNINANNCEEEINKMIEKVGLKDKQNNRADTLSGGQKRKLSVGIALVGNSKVVILDEPTSGMDVYARRFTWDLLLAEKANRTILLSTHFMEEADMLSERIAIMSNGRLQCSGSPLFLKKKYGSGYSMTIVKKSISTNITAITELVNRHIKGAKLQSSAGTEVTYNLPHEYSKQFEALFSDIETQKDSLEIDSYGVSLTTMEEVFLKVGDYAQKGVEALNQNHETFTNNISDPMKPKSIADKPKDRVKGCQLIKQQFYGLLVKKMLFSYRSKILTISQILILMLFAIYTIVISKLTRQTSSRLPELVLNLDKFEGADVPYFTLSGADSVTTKLADEYKNQFKGRNHIKQIPFSTSNLSESAIDWCIKKATEDIAYFNLRIPIGAEFCRSDQFGSCVQQSNDSFDLLVTGLFNNQAYHSIAISMAAIDSAIVRFFRNDPNYEIQVSNHPFPRTKSVDVKAIQEDGSQSRFAFNIMFAMSFLAASYSIFLVKEISVKFKHLQQVSGAKLYLYWITTFLLDYIIYTIAWILSIIVNYSIGDPPLDLMEQEIRIAVVFVINGLALLPFVYSMSFMFDTPSTAYVRICLFSVIIGSGSFIVVEVMELPAIDMEDWAEFLDWIFTLCLPMYNLGRCLSKLFDNYIINGYCGGSTLKKACKTGYLDISSNITVPLTLLPAKIAEEINRCCRDKCKDNCYKYNENFYGMESPGIGRILLIYIIQTIVFWVLITFIEYNFYRQIKIVCSREGSSEQKLFGNNLIDSDVKLESERLEKTNLKQLIETDSLIIIKLTKFYGKFCAVDHISYGVRRGECFGMLGVNGAGKTTTFKMITGDESITSGDIYVNGCNVKHDIMKVHKEIGYCPQFEGLLEELTGNETLVLFCRLRGIKEMDINEHITDISKLLYFDMHINKLVKNYSGGTKRKLSTAVALLGDPSVSFLDEPTTGVDPVARRCLWEALTKKLSEGRSIVLTSHSMEECESLCNRLIIMVNGKICCIGSPQQLKNKFGKGYTVRIKVLTADSDLKDRIQKVVDFIKGSFDGTVVKEIHYNLINFQINNTSIGWSMIFGTIENSKETLNIEDYSVGQTSLEQIFLTFAAKQSK